MTNNRNISLSLGSFSLAVFVIAKLGFLTHVNSSSMVIQGLVTAGLGFAVISLIVSLVNSFVIAMSPETKRLVRGIQAAAILVLIISLLTGGFGSLLAGYIHF
ncbi:hypothetical protein IJG93_04180 [Candidatus Saccharibacteria bacterium]|nr:hypothetical protein [Candidatus Saccharibacteria bacterium]MBR0424448.1 hypothetical protein [Candidatus Saccharibacteria bacterium]